MASAMADDGGQAEIQVEMAWPADMLFEPVNAFRISRIADEVQILTGYVNLAFVLDRVAAKKEVKVTPAPARGLSLSARAFKDLRDRVEEIYIAMEKAGIYD